MKFDSKVVKLCDISVKITKGTTPTSVGCNFVDSGINYIKSESICNSRILDKTKYAYIDEFTNEKLKRSQIEENDILFSMAGAYLGKTGIVRKEDVPANTNQAVAIIRLNHNLADYRYIYYYLCQSSIIEYVNRSSAQSAQPNINLKEIGNIEIDLPSITMQNSIADILSIIDDKIEINNMLNDNLAKLMNVMFQEWFDKHDEMEKKPLYELADYINGTSFKPDEYANEGIPIIKITELKNGITQTTQYFSGEKEEKYYIKNGDILFSWSGNPETSIDTFIWHDGNGILNQHTFKVVPKENEEVYIYLMLKFFKPMFTAIASNKQTTGLGHVTVADLKRLTFYYDGVKVKEFNEFVKPIYMKFYNNCIENGKLENLRDILLPKLMTGEVNVVL